MKKIVVLIFLIIGSFQTINSQEKSKKNLISSGKWYFEYMKFGDNKRLFPEKTKNENWMLFNKNGKAEITTRGIQSKEEWNYIEKKGIINITEDGEFTEYIIKKLNESEFIISRKYLNKITTIGLRK
tara:strand:- start:223 stop:603 length:381 start_codon:yes stop_codon:yes gene_type:complete